MHARELQGRSQQKQQHLPGISKEPFVEQRAALYAMHADSAMNSQVRTVTRPAETDNVDTIAAFR
jgi:hypothetical protein